MSHDNEPADVQDFPFTREEIMGAIEAATARLNRPEAPALSATQSCQESTCPAWAEVHRLTLLLSDAGIDPYDVPHGRLEGEDDPDDPWAVR